jgi:hypothetical protein
MPYPRLFSVLDPLEEDQVRVYYGNWRHLEIYLIEQFSGGGGGGGKAYNCGQAAAYIVLEADAADTNPYVLAHELGHVLGLGHPGEPGLTYLGSLGSIMVPARPNPNINTLSNCQIFTAGAQQQPLNPIVASTAAPDCFRPNAP